MKYIKEYNISDLFIDELKVVDIVKKIGYEKTAKYLSTLLQNKYVIFKDGIIAKGDDTPTKNTYSGTVTNIFYINTSGFIIARLNDNTNLDLIINKSTIECYEELDYDNALLVLNSDKYNL